MKASLLFALLFIAGCNGGPKLTICISDPAASGFQCFNENTGKSSVLFYALSDKYVALSPTDAQALFNFCNQPSK